MEKIDLPANSKEKKVSVQPVPEQEQALSVWWTPGL
jgi:hypothetical protein